MKQLKSGELHDLRIDCLIEQDSICPVLKRKFTAENMVVDHVHSFSSKNLGTNDAGLIRGVINREVNRFEGNMTKMFIRYGLHKFGISLPDFLRKLADYLESPPLEHKQFKHHLERPKPLKMSKVDFKKLSKKYKEKYGFDLKYPNSGNLTNGFQKLFDEFGIKPKIKIV